MQCCFLFNWLISDFDRMGCESNIMSSQIVECPNCGIEGQVGETCFKCDTKLSRSLTRPLYVIDVAHSGED